LRWRFASLESLRLALNPREPGKRVGFALRSAAIGDSDHDRTETLFGRLLRRLMARNAAQMDGVVVMAPRLALPWRHGRRSGAPRPAPAAAASRRRPEPPSSKSRLRLQS